MKLIQDLTEPELRGVMNALATNVVRTAETLGVEKPLFILLLFNDPKLTQYVANADRSTVVEALREAADRLERREDVPR